MKFFLNLLIFLSIIFVSYVLIGCGHNVAAHSKGYGIDISWQQDSFVPNLKVGYWDDSYVIVKENVEVKMKSNAGLNAEAGQTSKEGETKHAPGVNTLANGAASNEIEMKTGSQINGYTKDVLINPNLKKETVEAIKVLNGKETKD